MVMRSSAAQRDAAGWIRDRLPYLVMAVKIERPSASTPSERQSCHDAAILKEKIESAAGAPEGKKPDTGKRTKMDDLYETIEPEPTVGAHSFLGARLTRLTVFGQLTKCGQPLESGRGSP